MTTRHALQTPSRVIREPVLQRIFSGAGVPRIFGVGMLDSAERDTNGVPEVRGWGVWQTFFGGSRPRRLPRRAAVCPPRASTIAPSRPTITPNQPAAPCRHNVTPLCWRVHTISCGQIIAHPSRPASDPLRRAAEPVTRSGTKPGKVSRDRLSKLPALDYVNYGLCKLRPLSLLWGLPVCPSVRLPVCRHPWSAAVLLRPPPSLLPSVPLAPRRGRLAKCGAADTSPSTWRTPRRGGVVYKYYTPPRRRSVPHLAAWVSAKCGEVRRSVRGVFVPWAFRGRSVGDPWAFRG